jgi:hypothetical protein
MSDIYLGLAKEIRAVILNDYQEAISVAEILKRLERLDEDEIVLCSPAELAEEIL